MDRRDLPHPTQLELTWDRVHTGLDGHALRRARERGETNRLLRGIYVPSEVWAAADDDARYLMRIQAGVLTRQTEAVLPHVSVAQIRVLPVVGMWRP